MAGDAGSMTGWERVQDDPTATLFPSACKVFHLSMSEATGLSSESRLPWWQPFVWRWLVLSGWLPYHPRRRRDARAQVTEPTRTKFYLFGFPVRRRFTVELR